MILKIFALVFILMLNINAMPNVIDDYEEVDVPEADADKMKDSLSPTKDILEKADEIYENEQKDFEATVKIIKYRNLKSKNHNFLIEKKIILEDILSDTKSLDKKTQTKDSINLKRANND